MADSTTALYRHYGKDHVLLYIGISGNPGRRIDQHAKTKNWGKQILYSTTEYFPTREDAQEAEKQAIATEGPRHNVRHVNPDSQRLARSREWWESRSVNIALNRELQGFDIRLLMYALIDLDVDNWANLSHRVIATELRVSRSQVSRSFARLTQEGLLAKQGLHSYRLAS